MNAPRGSTDDIADVKVEDDEVQLLNIERRGDVAARLRPLRVSNTMSLTVRIYTIP